MNAGDTTMGGTPRAFPTTIWSDVLAAAQPDSPERRERLDHLFRAYWKPVYAYIRTAWRKPVEEAKDLTQAFFARVLQKDTLARLRPELGSLRGYLKRSLKHFLIDAQRAADARRPDRPVFSIEADPAELERVGPVSAQETPDRAYDREWGRSLLEAAIDALRETLARDGKSAYFEVFRAYCLEPEPAKAGKAPTYAEVARRLGHSEADVGNYLAFCREALRALLRERIRDTVDGEAEVERELKEVFEG